MSIFGGKSTPTLTAPVFEGYSCEHNGDLRAVQEGYEDMLAVIESIHALDMEEINYRREIKSLTEAATIEEKTAAFQVVAENAVKNVWTKIKAFFTKMWGKLKSFFASVVRFFDGVFKSGKDFATKYDKELRKLNLNGYEFKMFNYTNIDNDADVSNCLSMAEAMVDKLCQVSLTMSAEEVEKVIESIDEKKEDALDELRGKFVNKGNCDKDDFAEELFAVFRGGATSSDDKKDVKINIDSIIRTLENDKPLKAAEQAIKDCDTVFEKKIKRVNDMERAYEKVGDKKDATTEEKNVNYKYVSLAQKQASLFSEAKTIALDAFRAWKEAITERNSVYKQVCVQAFHYKKKD